jgi:putative transposase
VQPWHPRKRVRLDPSVYAQPGHLCSITIAVRDRQRVFTAPHIADAAIQVLEALSARHGVPIHAFCIMPDHVHLLLEPSDSCDIITFVGQFKNLAQREAWKLGVHGAFWQHSFWDHFLRADEDIEVVTNYIFENPVRAGLVDVVGDYPFSGSLTCEVDR